MGFLRRLRYYLIGVGLGILLVLAIFKDRNLGSWTPVNQIKGEIKEKAFVADDKLNCILACLEMDTTQFKDLLVSADINFKSSQVENQNNRIYLLELNDRHFELNIGKEGLKVVDYSMEDTNCICD